MEEFSNGTFVRLKSGGPMMTVIATFQGVDGPLCMCNWFENEISTQGFFSPEHLELEQWMASPGAAERRSSITR